MTTLSKEEARDIVKVILPGVRSRLKEARGPYPKTGIHIEDLISMHPVIRREGNTPDVFCKIAEAMSGHGIATDIDVPYPSYRASFIFTPAEKSYKKPSPEICKKKLDRAMRLEMKHRIE